jgi:hypothetical protein
MAVLRFASMLCPIAALFALGGCGGSDYDLAPVSGKVMLNGEPLADATVLFSPTAQSGDPGPPSWGRTDAQGNFTLKTRDGERGAVIGEHRVSITSVSEEDAGGGGEVVDDNVYDNALPQEKVPPQYNSETTLTFDVLSGGTDAANFDLEAPARTGS